MAKDTRRKLSDIMKELAGAVLRDPRAVPSSEAAHAALLLAHVAWNRSLGHPIREAQYRPMLDEFEQVNPELWNELRGNDPEQMIRSLAELKRTRYPQDERVIQMCGMRGGNVHVEWYDGHDVRDADCIATEHLARALELVLAGDEVEAVRHLCRTAGMSRAEARRQVGKLHDVLRGRKR